MSRFGDFLTGFIASLISICLLLIAWIGLVAFKELATIIYRDMIKPNPRFVVAVLIVCVVVGVWNSID